MFCDKISWGPKIRVAFVERDCVESSEGKFHPKICFFLELEPWAHLNSHSHSTEPSPSPLNNYDFRGCCCVWNRNILYNLLPFAAIVDSSRITQLRNVLKSILIGIVVFHSEFSWSLQQGTRGYWGIIFRIVAFYYIFLMSNSWLVATLVLLCLCGSVARADKLPVSGNVCHRGWHNSKWNGWHSLRCIWASASEAVRS